MVRSYVPTHNEETTLEPFRFGNEYFSSLTYIDQAETNCKLHQVDLLSLYAFEGAEGFRDVIVRKKLWYNFRNQCQISPYSLRPVICMHFFGLA